MRKWFMLIVCIPITVQGSAWYGYPLTNSTNAYTYYDMYTSLSNPVRQLGSGYWERVQGANFNKYTYSPFGVAGGSYTPFAEDDVILFAGYTNAVITNGTDVYTNKILVTTNLTPIATNLYGEVVYTYSDAEGSHTATGFPFLTRYRIVGGPVRIRPAFMYTLDRSLFIDADYYQYEASTGLVAYYAQTNYAGGDNYDTYLASTNEAGEYPSAIPACTKASLFEDYGIGHILSTTTNDWGATGEGQVFFLREEATANQIPLCDVNYDGAGSWTFRDLDKMVVSQMMWHIDITEGATGIRWPFDVTDYPVVVYHANSFSNLTITVTGHCFNAAEYTYTNYASESVAISSATTLLTHMYWDITDVTCSDNAQWPGDTLSIVYTSTPTFYGDPSFQPMAFTYDQYYHCLNGLVWRLERGNESTDPGYTVDWNGELENNVMDGAGTSRVDWATAVVNAIADTNYTYLDGASPREYTYGTLQDIGGGVTQWNANIYTLKARCRIKPITNAYQRSVDFYWAGKPYNPDGSYTGIYDNTSEPGIMEGYYQYDSTVSETDETNLMSRWVGTNVIPTWCDEPTAAIPHTSKGYVVSNETYIIKWNGANGFPYAE